MFLVDTAAAVTVEVDDVKDPARSMPGNTTFFRRSGFAS